MLRKYQFSLKIINCQPFFCYCFIYVFLTKFCICRVHDNVDFGDGKAVSVDPDEIIRRQNVLKNFLKERGNYKKDWIETYHKSFYAGSVFIPEKINQENSFEYENENDMGNSVNLHESLFNEMNSGENSNRKLKLENLKKTDDLTSEEFIRRRDVLISYYASISDMKISDFNQEIVESTNTLDNIYQSAETISSEKIIDQSMQESFKTDKDKDSLKNYNEQKPNSHGSTETSVSSEMESKKQNSKFINHINFLSNIGMPVGNICENHIKIECEGICSEKSRHKRKSRNNCNIKDNKSNLDIKFSSATNKVDLEMNEFKNLSANTNKIIEIMIKNSNLISEKYFISGETLTLTEFRKLHDNLARLSFLQKSKNNIYSVNRMNMIDSIGKVTPLLEKGELNQEKLKQLCNASETDNAISNDAKKGYSNIEKAATKFAKHLGHKVDNKEKTTKKRHKDLSNNLESTDKNDFSYDSEILRRKKVFNSFETTLKNYQKDWIETYHHSFYKSESEKKLFSSPIFHSVENKNSCNLHETADQDERFSKIHSQERLYIIRWINKLQNKLKDSHSGYQSLSILLSADLYKMLGELSQEFDIVMFDELVDIMISNATFHNNYAQLLHFNFENLFNTIYLSFNSYVMYIIIFSVGFILLCRRDSKNRLKLILPLLSLFIVLSFAWHANKMYQYKIAEKHSVMSRVVPSYCESILVQESGVFAHFKEFFRSAWHDENCKKYYEAVMVNPSAEITIFSVITDLLADSIFQILQPLGRNMNSFYKVLTYDLSFFHKIIIIIPTVVIIIAILYFILYFCLSFLAFRRNYKINFPFHLGSTEPTEFSTVGSRVEEINEKEDLSLKDSSANCNTLIVDCNKKTENKNHIEDVILQENSSKIHCKDSQLQPSNDYNNKTENKNHIKDVILQEKSSKIDCKESQLEPSKFHALTTPTILTRRNSI